MTFLRFTLSLSRAHNFENSYFLQLKGEGASEGLPMNVELYEDNCDSAQKRCYLLKKWGGGGGGGTPGSATD